MCDEGGGEESIIMYVEDDEEVQLTEGVQEFRGREFEEENG